MADASSPRLRASAVIPAALEFEGVGRVFGARRALDGVSLSIRPGEVLGLLGASGCGKSTLLRLAAGIDAPDEGTIRLDGKVISAPGAVLPPERRGIGLVFQDYALFPHLDALGNVLFGLSGLERREALAVADAALRRVGLGDRVRATPDMLSGGEQQRVALARAIVPRPRVLLMDEPFSNLDRRMRDSVREETIGILRETGATAIIVTHDPEEAMRLSNRIALMRAGRVVQVGEAKAFFDTPVDLDVARFFSDLNEVVGRVKGGAVDTALGRFPAPGLAEGAQAIAAVRPRSIRLRPAGCAVQGRVLAVRFVGDADLAEVAVVGLDRPLRLRCEEIGLARPGRDAGLEVIAGEVLVFAREPA